MTELGILAATIVGFAVAIPHVRRNRHPRSKPVEAFLIFSVAFGVVASTLFGFVVWAIEGLEIAWMSGFVAACVAAVASAGPAAVFATWLVRQPPILSPRVD